MYTQPQPHPAQTTVLPPRRRVKPAGRFPWLLVTAFVGFGGLIVIALVSVLALLLLAPERIPSGVTVATVEIGGATVEAATSLLNDNLPQPVLIVVDNGRGRNFQVSFADWGIDVDVAATIDRALAARRNTDLPFFYSVDLNQTQQGMVALSEQANIPATVEQEGWVMDIPAMFDRLRLDPDGELSDGTFELAMIPTERLNPASINRSDSVQTTHVVEAGQELGLIARQYGVSLQDILDFNNIANPDLIYEGQALTIPAAGEYQPDPASAPAAPTNTGKAIVVSTEDQRIYAYENGQMVRSHLVSTGTQLTPTVKGDFNIYVKYVADDMRGPDYFLPNVPYTMYFHRGYGIHGTYWHNSFGRPMSHGCVNLPIDEAEWFFNWAEVGTIVRVI